MLGTDLHELKRPYMMAGPPYLSSQKWHTSSAILAWGLRAIVGFDGGNIKGASGTRSLTPGGDAGGNGTTNPGAVRYNCGLQTAFRLCWTDVVSLRASVPDSRGANCEDRFSLSAGISTD